MRISLQVLRKAVESGECTAGESELFPLDYPLFPVPRIAVLGCAVRPGPGIHCLPEWTAADLALIRPMSLAGSWTELSAVAGLMRQGDLELPDLRHMILVFSDPVSGALSPQQHAALWDWFRLPTQEQMRASDGRLLASECEARDGFHLAAVVEAGDVAGVPVEGACSCGSRDPRVRLEPARALAAAAD